MLLPIQNSGILPSLSNCRRCGISPSLHTQSAYWPGPRLLSQRGRAILFIALAVNRVLAFFAPVLWVPIPRELYKECELINTFSELHYSTRVLSIENPNFSLTGSKCTCLLLQRGDTISYKVGVNLPFHWRWVYLPRLFTVQTYLKRYFGIKDSQSGSLLAIHVEMRELWRIISQKTVAFFITSLTVVSYSSLHCVICPSLAPVTPFSQGFLPTL